MRTKDKRLHVLATVMTLALSIFGFILYTLLRPINTLAEQEIEKLELSILQKELKEFEDPHTSSKKSKK